MRSQSLAVGQLVELNFVGYSFVGFDESCLRLAILATLQIESQIMRCQRWTDVCQLVELNVADYLHVELNVAG